MVDTNWVNHARSHTREYWKYTNKYKKHVILQMLQDDFPASFELPHQSDHCRPSLCRLSLFCLGPNNWVTTSVRYVSSSLHNPLVFHETWQQGG